MELNLEEVKDLLDAFEERNMQKLKLKKGDLEIVIERSASNSGIIHASPLINQANMHTNPSHASVAHIPSQVSNKAEETAETGRFITSPMVGTFYAAPSPDKPDYVKVGDKVNEGDVVCIIEAMKVMNEVKADASGVVKEILIESGHPVEFGTKIFKVS